jgi:hypothetical protein
VSKKLLYAVIFFGIFGAMFLFDFGRSKLFHVELVQVDPFPIPADGFTPVKLTARLTRQGMPVEGHDLYIVSLDGGNFTAYRINTNKAGEAVFTYYPYKTTKNIPLRDIRFIIRDESNSVFLEVNAESLFTVSAVEVSDENKQEVKLSDILGDIIK